MTEKEVRRRNRPNVYSDEHLLDAAAEVFCELGYHEASMKDVAARAGATKPTFYARFGSKEAVYDRIMERISESLIGSVREAYAVGLSTMSVEDGTRVPIDAFFRWVRSHPTGFRLLFVQHGAPTSLEHRDRALAALRKLVFDASADLLRSQGLRSQGLRAGRVTSLLAANVVGLLHHSALWAVEADQLDRMDVESFEATFLLAALQGVSPETVAAMRRRPARAAEH